MWLGNKKSDEQGREYLDIQKVIALPEPDPQTLARSQTSPIEKVIQYDNNAESHQGYQVIVDGHSHPVQDSGYKDFDRLPSDLLAELSLKNPGENYSLTDLQYYQSLLANASGVKDKTIVGAVITYTGALLTILLDDNDSENLPTTIRQITAKTSDAASIDLPTSKFNQKQAEKFFDLNNLQSSGA